MFELTEEQEKLFLRVHKRHMAMNGTSNQKKYALENVRNVEWDGKKDCLKVYYDDEWWHYDERGQWW